MSITGQLVSSSPTQNLKRLLISQVTKILQESSEILRTSDTLISAEDQLSILSIHRRCISRCNNRCKSATVLTNLLLNDLYLKKKIPKKKGCASMTMTTASKIGEPAKKLLNSLKIVDRESTLPQGEIFCRTKCKGLEQCQYGDGGRGYEPTTAYYDFDGKPIPYTIYTKCKYKVLAERRDEQDRLFRMSGLPMKFRDIKLNDVDAEEEDKINAAGFILGKIEQLSTDDITIGIAIGNELVNRRIDVKYVTISEMLTDLRYDNEEYGKNLVKYLNAEVLIINEQVAWRKTEYNMEQIEMIMERRERVRKRTLRIYKNGRVDRI